jgi:hypothetical protein
VRSHANGNGADGYNGPVVPLHLRYSREYVIAREAQYSFWTEMA